MNPESPDYYLVGHCIDGRVLYPATGYLVLAWRTLARSLGTSIDELPVTFEDIAIHQATILPKKGKASKDVLLGMQPNALKFKMAEFGGLLLFCLGHI